MSSNYKAITHSTGITADARTVSVTSSGGKTFNLDFVKIGTTVTMYVPYDSLGTFGGIPSQTFTFPAGTVPADLIPSGIDPQVGSLIAVNDGGDILQGLIAVHFDGTVEFWQGNLQGFTPDTPYELAYDSTLSWILR